MRTIMNVDISYVVYMWAELLCISLIGIYLGKLYVRLGYVRFSDFFHFKWRCAFKMW